MRESDWHRSALCASWGFPAGFIDGGQPGSSAALAAGWQRTAWRLQPEIGGIGSEEQIAAAARVRLIVWCWDCGHQVEPDPAGLVARYGAEMTVPDWRERLVCSRCDSRKVEMVVTGTKGS